jgi:hypothetical protein
VRATPRAPLSWTVLADARREKREKEERQTKPQLHSLRGDVRDSYRQSDTAQNQSRWICPRFFQADAFRLYPTAYLLSSFFIWGLQREEETGAGTCQFQLPALHYTPPFRSKVSSAPHFKPFIQWRY